MSDNYTHPLKAQKLSDEYNDWLYYYPKQQCPGGNGAFKYLDDFSVRQIWHK